MTQSIEKRKRRGVVLYEENPFVNPEFIDTVKTRVKRQTNQKGDMYVRAADGVAVGDAAGFWQAYEVESTQFVKLFVRGVKAFKELTGAGTKVFELLYMVMQKAIDKDRVYLSYAGFDENTIDMSRSTFARGLSELIDKGFLAPAVAPGWYWLNPNYVFNGDRLILVNEYRRKTTTTKPKQVTGQMEIDLLGLMGESAGGQE